MKRKVVFNDDVSNAVFNKRQKMDGCIQRVQNTSLVEESEIVSCNSEFQLINAAQKIALHEHHLQRKKCPLPMRQDICEAFWTVYKEETWNNLIHIVGTVI